MNDEIDWSRLRQRIAASGIPTVPKRHVGRRQLKKGTPEYEEFRLKEAERFKTYRAEHPDRVRESQKKWASANPSKVSARKHRFYEKHKQEILEERRRQKAADPEKYKRLKHEAYLRAKARKAAEAAKAA